MAEYIIRIRNSEIKTTTGEVLTLDTLLQQIKDVGGKVVDDGLKSALIDYDGTIHDLYQALQYGRKDILIFPLMDYKLPDQKKSVKS